MEDQYVYWRQVQGDLKGFVSRRVKDKALAEDIVHDVFLKVHASVHQLKDPDKILGWIYQITRNTIADHFRRQSRVIRAQDLDWEAGPPNFNDCVSNAIVELMPGLPEKYRIPLELTGLQDTPQREIAMRLRLNYSTVKARVQRARQMLKQKLEAALVVRTDGYGNVIFCKDRGQCC